MATIRLYLDIRRVRSNGEYPVKIVVNHNKDIMFSTGVTSSKSTWDENKWVLTKKADGYTSGRSL